MPIFLGLLFYTVKLYSNFAKKWVGLHFGFFFHKLIWSPRIDAKREEDERRRERPVEIGEWKEGKSNRTNSADVLNVKGDINMDVDLGSILQNSVSAENFSDKFSSSNFGQSATQKATDINSS
jgi:hypothetical protein